MTSTTKLEQLLDELVRPALRAHGGDAELVSFQDWHPPARGCWVSAPAAPPPP